MVNSIKSILEADENIAWKFTVVHILENCVNIIKYQDIYKNFAEIIYMNACPHK